MNSRCCIFLASAICLFGCRTAYHVVTAPVRLVHHPNHSPENSTASSDVVTPGQPVTTTTTTTSHPIVLERSTTASPSPTSRSTAKMEDKPKATSPRTENFPTAKPVPNKPGYVYSPSDATKYVDVTGYASGSKVKDPYSGKIFLVP